MNAESVVRMLLSQEFRMPFTKMTLEVGTAIDGKPALKEFDAVSGDQRVIAMVKDCTAVNIKGNQTRHARVMRDLYYLSLCQAEHRFLFLSSSYYDWLKTQRDAAIAPGIKLRLIPKLGLAGYPTVSGTQSWEVPNVSRHRLDVRPIISKSKRHEGKRYLYWWDIWDSRKNDLSRAGQIHFVKRDTGERSLATSKDLLPLLTETRRTSRMRKTTGGNWGIKVLANHPDELAIEPGSRRGESWAYLPVKWIPP